MEVCSGHDELSFSNLLFQRVFSNIQIERTDKKGKSSWLKVPCVNGQRSRILKSFENAERKSMYKLPLIAYTRTGITRAPDRLNNLHNEVKFEITKSNRNYSLLTPQPIDISYDVVIMAKYQSDIDRIASNFMVFFNNDIYVSCEHPVYSGLKLHNQIVMGDSVSEDHPDELDASRDDIVTSTFSFTFKTFLFGGTRQFRRRTGQISTYLSSVLSDVVFQFESEDQLREYLKDNPVQKLSATTQVEVEIPVSTYVDVSSDEYDDGIPMIRELDFGFYAVPTREDFAAWMLSVDSEAFGRHAHVYPPAYISSESYTGLSGYRTDDEGNTRCVLSALSSVGDEYRPVDGFCTYAPFVDRVKWKIDTDSTKDFPNNIVSYGEVPPVEQ